MYKAREAYIQLESDKTIREALKQRLYTSVDHVALGDWIFYKDNNRWFGPVRVVGVEGKRIHVMRAGRINTVNRDNV